MSKSKLDLNKRYHLQLPSPMSVLITLGIGLAVGYLGPFGSFQMPLSQRLLYWVVLIGVGHFIYSQTDKLCQWYLAKKQFHVLVNLIISSLFGSVFLAFFVEYVSYFFFDLKPAFPENFLFFFPKVFILGMILNVIGLLLDQVRNKSHSAEQPAAKGNPFLKRLPHQLGTELVCFSMEDHYLQVHTDQGDHMMLLRMKDALVELQDYPGLQVHRSWWVAVDAVVAVKKLNRKAILTMNNGMEVPVSQKYLPKLKEVGLLN